MTNTDYLEQYATLTNKYLPEVALMLGRGDADSATNLVTLLQTKLSDLWTSYMAQASAAVAP